MSGNDRGYGYPGAGKPAKKMMDDGDDTTRKVAAGGAGISFAPMTPSFSPMSFDASSQTTQTQKARAGMAGPVSGYQAKPSSTQQPFRWMLSEIPTLPEFHPLERTAVFVEGASPSEVSSRISNVLRQRSIEASYDDAKAKVRCMSASGVDFRVRLYRGRGDYSHGIIVEVQRRFGHSIDFYSDTNAILDGAQGLPTIAPPPPALRPSSGNNLPMVSDTEDDDDFVPSKSGVSSLKMISKMLGNNTGYDSYYLALQTLASLTDAARMGSATAKSVATELLKPDNEVGSKLVDLIVSKKQKEEDVFNLQVMALTILANALASVRGQIPDMLRELFRPALLRELEEADSSNLLAAQQAARCLEYTWKGDHDVGQLQAALENAKSVGEARHSGLEQQAQATLSRIAVGN